jgi:hypothetical protein
VYLFGFPQSVYADIRTTREHSLVDDWIDILLYYPEIRVRLKAGFVREAIPAYAIHGKRIFPETAGDVQEDDLKLGKTKFGQLGTESIEKKGSCMPKLTAK